MDLVQIYSIVSTGLISGWFLTSNDLEDANFLERLINLIIFWVIFVMPYQFRVLGVW